MTSMTCRSFISTRGKDVDVETTTVGLENINAVNPAAIPSLSAGATSCATHPSIASSPKSSNAQSSTANTTTSAFLAKTSSRVTTRTFTREGFSLASRTRPSSPKPTALLEMQSLKLHSFNSVSLAKISRPGGCERSQWCFACAVLSLVAVLQKNTFNSFTSQSLQRTLRENRRGITLALCFHLVQAIDPLFPHSHYRDFMREKQEEVDFLVRCLTTNMARYYLSMKSYIWSLNLLSFNNDLISSKSRVSSCLALLP